MHDKVREAIQYRMRQARRKGRAEGSLRGQDLAALAILHAFIDVHVATYGRNSHTDAVEDAIREGDWAQMFVAYGRFIRAADEAIERCAGVAQ